MKITILTILMFVGALVQAQTTKVYYMVYDTHEQALEVQSGLVDVIAGHSFDITPFGAQVITPQTDSTDLVMDNRYFVMAMGDTLLPELYPYIIDVPYFKPVYAGMKEEWIVEP